MVSTAPPRPASNDDTSSGEDWPAQVADSIERVVGTVRDRTVGPAVKVARAVVYGVFAAIVGLTAAVISVLLLVRAVDIALPDAVFGTEHTWVTYLILGLLFVGGSAILWRLRRPPEQTAPH